MNARKSKMRIPMLLVWKCDWVPTEESVTDPEWLTNLGWERECEKYIEFI